MKKLFVVFSVLSVVLMVSLPVYATNGDNIIAVGPIARSMGGVGIAYPQDAISAVFANPAAMCFGPYCPTSEFDFSGTLFMPQVEAKVTGAGFPAVGTVSERSEDKVYPIPAIGLSVPITKSPPFWRFGIAAYGVSGLGVDYRDTALDNPTGYTNPAPPPASFPLIAGEFTELQIMKFAPAIAFQPSDKWSFGLALHLNYGSLDLRQGTSSNYGIGAQFGVIYKPVDNLSFGLTYVSPQKIDHDDVNDFDGDGRLDGLTLESPQQIGFGVSYYFVKILVEADIKWLNWANADGYEDFDWKNQWVFAIGAQFKPIPNLTLRAGYNYGKSPLEENDGFVGGAGKTVQGKTLPTYYYETFRVIGFPAIVEHHVTVGIGYDFSPTFGVHLGYMYGFENKIKETGTDFFGQPVTLESSLSEQSIDFGLLWRF